ncbi:MAG TPA: glycosyltransferase family 87 protein, partial [Dehalococcoidia bacterium]|nr:glycosyltransferase family 87 protein [Dehalococcoidia bacterium]
LDPYGVHEGLVEESGLNLGFDDRPYSPNLNPPVSIYPFRLLAGADPDVTRFGLRAVSAVVYVAACLALMRAYPWQRRPLAVLWLIAGAGFWYTLWMGQIYVLLFGAGLGAWLLLEKGQSPVLAGVLIGVTVAVKPNFALWPLMLLLAGHGRPALWAGITALLISAVPFVIEGPSIYGQWLDAARHYSRGAIAANGSLVGSAARLGFEPAGYALAGLLTLAGAVYAWRLRPGPMEASAATLIVTLLAGPLTWLGYTLFALPVLMSRQWRGWELAVGATLVVPAGLTAAAGEVHLAGMLVLGGLVAGDAVRSRRTESEVEPSRSPALTVREAA